MTSKREEHIAEALGNTIGDSDRVSAQYITAELRDFGQRAWALRARVVDVRGLVVSFVVSMAMLDLLRKHGLDLGAGPGGMFARGPLGGDKLFGIDIFSDSDEVGSSRHREIVLQLVDDGEFTAPSEIIDMSTVRGVPTTDDAP